MGASQSSQSSPVVIGLDSSYHSQRAFDWYDNSRKQLGTTNAEVILVNSINISSADTMLSTGGPQFVVDIKDQDELVKKMKASADKLKASYLKQCESSGMKCRWEQHFGDPGLSVTETAKENKAGLIVVGTRGESTWKRTVLGSVSDYIMQESDIPLIIVPPSNP